MDASSCQLFPIPFDSLTNTMVKQLKTGALINMEHEAKKLIELISKLNASMHYDTSEASNSEVAGLFNVMDGLTTCHALYVKSREEYIRRLKHRENI